MTRRSKPRAKARRLTQARVKILWDRAREKVREGRPDVARRHMLSARTIARKTRTKLPRHMSRRNLSDLWGGQEILPVVYKHRLMSEHTRAGLISDERCKGPKED